MKIAIDARMIKPGSMHGIARYVFQLLHCFRRITEHEFFVFVNENSPLAALTWPEHIHLTHVKSRWISFREQWELPRILKSIQADLLHAPSFVAPIFCPCKLVMTIHDLNHLVLPQFYTPFHQFYYRTFVRSCIARSSHILTVSNFSKAEIVKNLKLKPEKISVTYCGVSDRYKPCHDQNLKAYIRDVYELPEKFIFCLSNNKPHKNVQQLVRAYCYSDIKVPLVLASPVDVDLIRIAETFDKKHLIYFSRFIAEEHLPAVYSMAHLFVFPSTYEGFGLPPLEALACGIPVVVAQSSSLPEVVGKFAIFANPFDYRDIAHALERGVFDDELRNELIESGWKHASRYTWERMAVETLKIYQKSQEIGAESRQGALV